MKAFLLLLTGVLTLSFAHRVSAAAYVNFSNTSSTRFLTNDAFGNFGYMSGAKAFRIGLYVGPFGTEENSLQLVGLATNLSFLPGRFNGGNPIDLPAQYDDAAPISFQVRVWAFGGGMSYEEALGSGFPGFVAKTAMGYVTPAIAPTPPPMLFGLEPGKIYGLQPPMLASTLAVEVVPEPSVTALAALAASVLGVCSRMRRRVS